MLDLPSFLLAHPENSSETLEGKDQGYTREENKMSALKKLTFQQRKMENKQNNYMWGVISTVKKNRERRVERDVSGSEGLSGCGFEQTFEESQGATR